MIWWICSSKPGFQPEINIILVGWVGATTFVPIIIDIALNLDREGT
jgi:hypothetical protein